MQLKKALKWASRFSNSLGDVQKKPCPRNLALEEVVAVAVKQRSAGGMASRGTTATSAHPCSREEGLPSGSCHEQMHECGVAAPCFRV